VISPAAGWPRGFGDGSANRRALLVLSSLPGITPRRLLALATHEGSAEACLRAIKDGAGSTAQREAAARIDPDEVRDSLAACGGRLVPPGTPEYPPGLEDLADPPVALFARGRPLADLVPGVALVGARRSTAGGREVARTLGAALARAGVTVVSGAAIGIDTESHRGALAAAGPTIAVLGSGIDVAHPPSNRSLLARIEASGAVVSEYPPGTPALPFRFPARNRVVAAMSRAVVVVEGSAGSGALITVEHALDIGRAVFAVPGPVWSDLAQAPLSLIREGATMIRGSDDLLADLGLADRSSGGVQGSLAPLTVPGPGLSPQEAAAVAALAGATLPEDVARALRLGLAQVMPILLALELRGIVRNVGGRYERRFA
jgi:DNA processing protein